MIYIKIFLTQVLICIYALLAAQNFEQQRTAISENGLTQKRTVTITYNNGQQKDSFVSTNTSFNRLGFPLQQTLFNKNGKVQGRFVSQYQSDSLEIKETSFDSTENRITETFKGYNSFGQLISMKVVLYVSDRTIYHIFEYDNDRFIRKNYLLDGDTKTLMSISSFNENWQLQKSTYYNSDGEVKSITAFEFDSITTTRKSFSIKKDVKKLRSSQLYSGSQLTEELHYYDNMVTLSNGYGSTQTFKTGDLRKVVFAYNDKGLLQEQVETVNGQITLRLKFEYYE